MNTTQTLAQMQQLRLQGMYQCLPRLNWNYPWISNSKDMTWLHNWYSPNNSTEPMKKQPIILNWPNCACLLPSSKSNARASRNLTKQQLATLMEGRYLQQGENVLITGSTGCGKSYLACALGHQACLQGYKTTYLNMNRLIEKVTLIQTGWILY